MWRRVWAGGGLSGQQINIKKKHAERIKTGGFMLGH